MALTHTPKAELGSPAKAFKLPATDGKVYSLSTFTGAPALVVVFMCNHCPYVQAVDDRINQLARDYLPLGVKLVGINSNDAKKYPDDSFEAMKEKAAEKGYIFPYLFDESQEVAKAYGAVCTPDFFVYDKGLKLRYRGRLDDNWKNPEAVTKKDLAAALDAILSGTTLPAETHPSMGCSIKWR